MTRWLRHLALLFAFAFGVALLQGVAAAVANAATATTTPVNWLNHVPVPYIAGILIGAGVIPILSAIATSHPSALTGLIAAALSLLDAVLTAVAHAGNDSWQTVAGTAVSTWVGAKFIHTAVVKKRDGDNQPVGFEARLHAIGNRATVTSQKGAIQPVALFLALGAVLFLVLLLTGHLWLAVVVAIVAIVAIVIALIVR